MACILHCSFTTLVGMYTTGAALGLVLRLNAAPALCTPVWCCYSSCCALLQLTRCALVPASELQTQVAALHSSVQHYKGKDVPPAEPPQQVLTTVRNSWKHTVSKRISHNRCQQKSSSGPCHPKVLGFYTIAVMMKSAVFYLPNTQPVRAWTLHISQPLLSTQEQQASIAPQHISHTRDMRCGASLAGCCCADSSGWLIYSEQALKWG